MRILLAAALALALLPPALPDADARHAGPCTHEWFEGLKNPGPVATADGCVRALTDWLGLCEAMDPCLP